MLRKPRRSLPLLAASAIVLWIVPSIGTQGMGTIGRRIVHTDAALFDTNPARRAASSSLLVAADTVTETAADL